MMVAALVIVVMSALGLKYYSELVHDKVHDLLEQNNGQAIENIEIILDNAVRLTEYPMLNKMVSELLSKDYGRIEPENQKYGKSVPRKRSTALFMRVFSIITPTSVPWSGLRKIRGRFMRWA